MHPKSLLTGIVFGIIQSQSIARAFTSPLLTTRHQLYGQHLVHQLAMSTKALDLEQIKGQVSRAISIGAPAYNAGDIKGCADTYAATAQSIVDGLPDQLKTSLDECLEQINDDRANVNDDAKAWALRRQFDAILDYSPPFLPASVNNDNVVLEPFTAQQLPPLPIEVMDNVMGGISRGSWAPSSSSPSVGSFRGTTSLANNGGFASLRWRFQTLQNWSYAKGIFLKVQHTNPGRHAFRLILKDGTCERIRLTNFKAVFANPSPNDNYEPILIPFAEMGDLEQMGNPMVGAPSFNPSAVTEIGIMAIKPAVVGEFEIKILDWGLYS